MAILLVMSSTNFVIQDYFGRRPLLLVGGCVQTLCMIGLGAVTAKYPQPVGAYGKLALFFVFIWNVFFASCWGATPWTISAETPADDLRDKTLAFSSFSAYTTGLVVAQVSPYLQNAEYANLGGKIGFIWGGFSAVATVWTFFVVPELKGRTLEEIGYMFEQKVPNRMMGSYIIPDLVNGTREPNTEYTLGDQKEEIEHLDAVKEV